MRLILLSASIVYVASQVGCNPGSPANQPGDGAARAEEEIKTAFAGLQGAIKAKDSAKIWGLLAKDSQDDAEREARGIKEAFAKVADKDKPESEKKVGLSAREITDMTGQLYVKSRSFFRSAVNELPDSKMDKVVVTGDSGMVHYTEEDGDKEKMAVVREQGQWKFAVPVPKAVLK